MALLHISKQEYKRRQQRIRNGMIEQGLDALYLTSFSRIFYATGYHLYSEGRPVGCLIRPDGEIMMLVPFMEERRIQERWPWMKDVVSYFEYPVKNRPDEVIDILVQALKDRNLEDKRIGTDGPALLSKPDFRPASLESKMPKAEFVYGGDVVDDIRIIKSEEELALIEEAATWCNLAHTRLHKYVKPGMTEIEVSARATHEASLIMLDALGPDFAPWGMLTAAMFTARAGCKAGSTTAHPHGYYKNRKIRVGDVVETGGSATVGGYHNHIERTLIVGEPSEEQKTYFNLMLKAQDAAFAAMKPGVTASSVHDAVLDVIRSEGYEPESLLLHRSGRGLGLDGYEPPTLFEGDDTILQSGMIFQVEPGIYLPHCCFRHCDTVVVTEDGYKDFDFYPRDLEYLTISV